MVIGRLDLPLVHRGDAIIHIAHLDRLKKNQYKNRRIQGGDL